jgi:hypothetical protein
MQSWFETTVAELSAELAESLAIEPISELTDSEVALVSGGNEHK